MAKKTLRFFLVDRGTREERVEIDTSDTFADVRDKVLTAFGMSQGDTLGKTYLQQNIEIRDLDSIHYKEKRFLGTSPFDEQEPIEVHFKRVPILFLLFTNDKKTMRKVLHVDPANTLTSLKELVVEKFGLRESIDLDFLHQNFQLPEKKRLIDFTSFDPAHSIVVLPRIFLQEPERLPLE